MDNHEFNSLIDTLPKRTVVIGHMADGTAITAKVPSLFASEEEQ